jgi:hypothetical protein
VGTKVRGHVARIRADRRSHARAYCGGNFSPLKRAALQFDTLWLDDGSEVPIDTVVAGGIPNTRGNIAGGSKPGGRERPASTDEPISPSVRSRVSREIWQRQRAREARSTP